MQSSLDFSPREPEVLSVSGLTGSLRELVESRFSDVWVEGELSNFKRHSSGHCYFTLKDEDAQIRGVMFRGDARRVSFNPQDGMLVHAYGSASVYEPRGDLQIIVRGMKMAGEGALQKAFEALKNKLAAEGLFDRERKRPIPRYPLRLGIVTSGTGAALHDILSTLERRFPCVDVQVCPVQVQGMGAGDEIARAIDLFNRQDRPADALIVGRGGGSLEDLWAFNEEVVARAVHASRIPIISAVGHETDFSICDFVADRRAATPSMAAEIAVPDRKEILGALDARAAVLTTSLQRHVDQSRRHIRHLISTYGFKRPADRLRQYVQRVDGLVERLNRSSERRIEVRRSGVQALRDRLELLSPTRPLERGYILVERGDGIIRDAAAVSEGDRLVLRFANGRVPVTADGPAFELDSSES
ncbi:MAG: exodeoxyribonuclease VII large subunit [Rhodothermales bacterium]